MQVHASKARPQPGQLRTPGRCGMRLRASRKLAPFYCTWSPPAPSDRVSFHFSYLSRALRARSIQDGRTVRTRNKISCNIADSFRRRIERKKHRPRRTLLARRIVAAAEVMAAETGKPSVNHCWVTDVQRRVMRGEPVGQDREQAAEGVCVHGPGLHAVAQVALLKLADHELRGAATPGCRSAGALRPPGRGLRRPAGQGSRSARRLRCSRR